MVLEKEIKPVLEKVSFTCLLEICVVSDIRRTNRDRVGSSGEKGRLEI